MEGENKSISVALSRGAFAPREVRAPEKAHRSRDTSESAIAEER